MIGKLRHFVDIERKTVSGTGDRGQPALSWSAVYENVGAEIEQLSGRKLEIARQVIPSATHSIRMRYHDLYDTLETVGPLFPGTVAVDASIGHATKGGWTNPSLVMANDGSYAQGGSFGSADLPGITNYLVATNFGFEIPDGSVIVGIEFEIEKDVSVNTFSAEDHAVRVVRDGVIGETDKGGTSWFSMSPPVVATHGGSDDLWGETWTPALINASDFGIAISAEVINGAIAAIFYGRVDYITCSVTYGVVDTSVAMPKHRIKFGDRYFYLHSLNNKSYRNRWLEMIAEEA